MEAKAIAKYVRTSPRKARQVIDLIRGKNVKEAFAILQFVPRHSSSDIEKVLKSAVANATHNYQLDESKLIVSSCFINEGPTIKRFKPRAQGRADSIRKRTSHITVVVSEKKEG